MIQVRACKRIIKVEGTVHINPGALSLKPQYPAEVCVWLLLLRCASSGVWSKDGRTQQMLGKHSCCPSDAVGCQAVLLLLLLLLLRW